MAPNVMTAVAILLSLVLSGCIAGDPDNSTPLVDPTGEADMGSIFTSTIAGHGQTEGLLCDPITGCRVTSAASDIFLPDDMRVWHIEGEVTWDPIDPTLDSLEVFLLKIDENGDWSWEYNENTYWAGTSPLKMTSHVGDEWATEYHVHARTRHAAPDPASGVRFNLGSQEYHAELVVSFVDQIADATIGDAHEAEHEHDHNAADAHPTQHYRPSQPTTAMT